ncbi:HAD family hydrolase [Liquorilactobacillus uvarum]|uniref:HAD family hydrolase n=1 Tax=Liquorilactobacillus uvarum TaxID=303240 RepID=UPI00288960BD|nr:HAD family hydrolase [Liquorilactobacillus uvarum]
MIKHIFLDMDNTLLNSAGKLSPENTKIIKNCHIPVTLVSARPPKAMSPFITELELSGEQVAFNGGVIFKLENSDYQTVFSEGIAFKTIVDILESVKGQFPQTSLSWFTLKRWYTDKLDKRILRESSITGVKPEIMPLNQLSFLRNSMIYKIMLISRDMNTTDVVYKYLMSLNLNDITVTRSNSNYLELINKNISKENGVAYIQAGEGLEKKELAAFGDGENDIDMFNAVEMSIAMANASNLVKSRAKFVTLSNDDNGVGYGIKEILTERYLF